MLYYKANSNPLVWFSIAHRIKNEFTRSEWPSCQHQQVQSELVNQVRQRERFNSITIWFGEFCWPFWSACRDDDENPSVWQKGALWRDEIINTYVNGHKCYRLYFTIFTYTIFKYNSIHHAHVHPNRFSRDHCLNPIVIGQMYVLRILNALACTQSQHTLDTNIGTRALTSRSTRLYSATCQTVQRILYTHVNMHRAFGVVLSRCPSCVIVKCESTEHLW